MGELARAGRTESSRQSYKRYLHTFVSQVERRTADASVRDVTTNDRRAFLDNWIGKPPSTRRRSTVRSTVSSHGCI
jgi:hypothetical protein